MKNRAIQIIIWAVVLLISTIYIENVYVLLVIACISNLMPHKEIEEKYKKYYMAIIYILTIILFILYYQMFDDKKLICITIIALGVIKQIVSIFFRKIK